MTSPILKPAAELASSNARRFPNESAEYRRARQALLVEEIELRRHIARVAELRRALPPGGEVTRAYEFTGESGAASLADLFGNKQTLIIHSYMFGPQREKPCPNERYGPHTADSAGARATGASTPPRSRITPPGSRLPKSARPTSA